jgi:hypothetical protein
MNNCFVGDIICRELINVVLVFDVYLVVRPIEMEEC